ncbi:MAG: LysE family translocator [Pseudomonadota bacterium]
MFGIQNYPGFMVAVLVFLAIPGPGLLGVLAATGQGGIRAGFASTLGVVTGDWVHMLLAALGVAALLKAHPMAFKALQYGGAFYLIYIGVTLWRMKVGEVGETGDGCDMRPTGAHFRRGFLITLLNPKAIVFYMAFFPLFIDPATHLGTLTLVAMAITVSLLTIFFCFTFVIVVNALAGKLKRNPVISKFAHRAAGVFLIGFGIKLTSN